MRYPRRRTLTTVFVSPYKLKNGQWSKKRMFWASFALDMDASLFVDQLRKAQPDWIIHVRRSFS